MIENDLDNEIISKVTDLTIEKVQKIREGKL